MGTDGSAVVGAQAEQGGSHPWGFRARGVRRCALGVRERVRSAAAKPDELRRFLSSNNGGRGRLTFEINGLAPRKKIVGSTGIARDHPCARGNGPAVDRPAIGVRPVSVLARRSLGGAVRVAAFAGGHRQCPGRVRRSTRLEGYWAPTLAPPGRVTMGRSAAATNTSAATRPKLSPATSWATGWSWETGREKIAAGTGAST